MSTNKTTNYQLHSWEPGDDFLRSEFNENFSALDRAVKGVEMGAAGALNALVVTGTYTGDGAAQRDIVLGFTPRAVLVFDYHGHPCDRTYCYGGLAAPGLEVTAMNNPALSVIEGGFRVYYIAALSNSWSIRTNENKTILFYLAIR